MMKNQKKYIVSTIITSILLMGYTNHSQGQDKETSFETSQDRMIDIMEQALTALTDQGDENIRKRVQKRVDARKTQEEGEKFNKKIKGTTSFLSGVGSTASMVALATGDPLLKVITSFIFKIAVNAVGGLGKGVSTIMTSVGRYQERSQEILSITEVLVEDMQKSIEKIRSLQKKQQSLLGMEKTPEPSQSSSGIKQLAKNLHSKTTRATRNIESKVRDTIDPLTNEKAARQEKLKAIQIALKEEKENFSEIVKLLQIKLLQDGVKEIDKKINIDKTIEKLREDIQFYQVAKANISKSASKKQVAEIEAKTSRTSKDLDYYVNLQKSPGEESPEILQEQKSTLIEEIKRLTQSTKLGDSLYLQERGIDLDAHLDKATIVALYKEIEDLKKQFNDLKSQIKTPPNPGAPSLSRPLPAPSPLRGMAQNNPMKQFNNPKTPSNPNVPSSLWPLPSLSKGTAQNNPR